MTDEPEEVPGQVAMFSDADVHKARQHWKQMPEFVAEDLTPYRQLIVNFATRADLDRFALAIEQPIGPKVRSIWYPEAEIGRFADKRYITVEERQGQTDAETQALIDSWAASEEEES